MTLDDEIYEKALQDTLNSTGEDDEFRPPKKSVKVRCLHCEDVYQSREMVFEQRFSDGFKLWYCRNKDCSGAGYGFDIHEVKK